MSGSEWLRVAQVGFFVPKWKFFFFGILIVSKAPPCAPPTSVVPTGRDKAIPWLLPGVARNSGGSGTVVFLVIFYLSSHILDLSMPCDDDTSRT